MILQARRKSQTIADQSLERSLRYGQHSGFLLAAYKRLQLIREAARRTFCPGLSPRLRNRRSSILEKFQWDNSPE